MNKLYYISLALAMATLTSCERIFWEENLASNDPRENFEYLWNQVDRHYSYFDLKEIDWNEVKTRYSDSISDGMNEEELAANPQLTQWFVQDLNQTPVLPLDAGSFDAALCCVGVHYLQRPGAVFAGVRRLLVPGAPFIVSFSNRCFPTKAVAIWRALEISGHAALVKLYLERAGFGEVRVDLLADGRASDPLVAVTGRA